ncbi:MAG: hypothetical protein WCG97_02045 [bacterium]
MNDNRITSQNIDNVGYRTLFTGDVYLMYVHKKTHGISRAVYLITDFFDDKEPIKVRMRDLACDLVSSALSLSTELSPERKNLLDNMIRTGVSLISYSEIAMFSGIESQMNHSLLAKEIQSLLSTIEEKEMPSHLGRHFVLDEAFFSKDTYDHNQHSHSAHHTTASHRTHHTLPSQPKLNPRTSQFKKNNTSGAESQASLGSQAADQKKTQRRNSILSIIRTKGSPSIKDIADGITDCSEKTIQRELLDMVAGGLLKKEGERRWSRYSIAA